MKVGLLETKEVVCSVEALKLLQLAKVDMSEPQDPEDLSFDFQIKLVAMTDVLITNYAGGLIELAGPVQNLVLLTFDEAFRVERIIAEANPHFGNVA